MIPLDNLFTKTLPQDPVQGNRLRQVSGAAWSQVELSPVAAPSLLAYSSEMLAELELSVQEIQSPDWVQTLAGNRLQPGMLAYATCYGGHQFGNWAGQLGDGRVINLGEGQNSKGRRWELQLKGAGLTPYSRGADGRAVLRSSVREFLCSEAMHHLGVPTTRALSLVTSGEMVTRDMFYDGNPVQEPGAIVCRVSPSFIRFGHFQLQAARGELGLLQKLVDFTIARDFPPHLFPQLHAEHLAGADLRVAWLAEVCRRTAKLMVKWMQVGFVHGVMNTDNMSILGLTIDYGPYGWIEHFDPGWTPNTTDAMGRRYCFGQQPAIARWNLEQLAEALYPLVQDVAALRGALAEYDSSFEQAWAEMLAGKLGLSSLTEQDQPLVEGLFSNLTQGQLDMTLFFRQLTEMNVTSPDMTAFQQTSYREDASHPSLQDLQQWISAYVARIGQDSLSSEARLQRMQQHNPCYVLRNYLAQEAIDQAEQGDASLIEELLEVLRKPYQVQAGKERFAQKRPAWAVNKPGCSMLSCSS